MKIKRIHSHIYDPDTYEYYCIIYIQIWFLKISIETEYESGYNGCIMKLNKDKKD